MTKMAMGMALGFLVGMVYQETGKKMCLKKMKNRLLRSMGL